MLLEYARFSTTIPLCKIQVIGCKCKTEQWKRTYHHDNRKFFHLWLQQLVNSWNNLWKFSTTWCCIVVYLEKNQKFINQDKCMIANGSGFFTRSIQYFTLKMLGFSTPTCKDCLNLSYLWEHPTLRVRQQIVFEHFNKTYNIPFVSVMGAIVNSPIRRGTKCVWCIKPISGFPFLL